MRTSRCAVAGAAALLATTVAIPASPAAAATGDPVLINEVLGSTTSTDAEYIELFGTPGASLAGLSVIVVESDEGASNGTIDARADLPADATIGSNGFYLLASPQATSVYGVAPDFSITNNFVENSSYTVALVETVSISSGTVDVGIVSRDAIAVTDGGAADVFHFGAPIVGPDGTFLPAGVGRVVDGVDTDTAADWMMLDFDNASPPNSPTAGTAPTQPTVINASLISTTGVDAEYVELYGEPGASLGGIAVVGIEGDAGSPQGRIDHYYELPATAAIGENGFYLLANATAATTFGVTPNFDIPENGLENSSITLALVEVAALGGKDAGDVLDGTEDALDAVGVTDGGAGDLFYFDAPVVGPDGTFLPAGVRRLADGVDTDTAADWTPLVFSPADAPANVPTVGTGDTGSGPIAVKIHAVQGSGASSPLVGQRVIVEGVVVGDEEGPAPALRGFFVQEEDADADADDDTSEGVFVFNFDDDDVNVGDHVRVEGTVEERSGNTQLAEFVDVEVLGSVPLPSAATVTFPVASVADLEAYEGMLATLTDTLVISEYFNYDRFGEIVVAKPSLPGTGRVMTPTAVYSPSDPAAAALRDLNLRSRITVDDGNSFQNPEVNIHPINREPFSLVNSFRGGDTVTGLTGPIYYAFDLYRILPLGDLDGDGTGDGYTAYVRNPAPASPDPVGGDLRVASLNALNYFVSLDTDDTCGPTQDQDCRGADDREEFERQHAKLMNTLVGLDADVVGLIEVENTTGVEALATIVDGEEGGLPGLNDLLGEGTYAYVAAGGDSVVGTDAIKVGVIYKPASVTPYGGPAILDSHEFLDPLDSGSDRNRAAVAQTFVENASGEVFSVVVNHLKSKGSACGEPAEGGLTGSCNLTRTVAAGVLADWLAGDPTGSGDADWLILGDLNSYDKEDPIVALQDAGYADLIGQYGGEYAYSYVFDGEVGYLDYIMSNPSMTAQVTGATEWHINADEPDIVDYDTGFKSDAQDAFFDPTTPYRSSDHDAALVGLSLDAGFDATVDAVPSMIWPPNHKLRSIDLVPRTDGADLDVLSASSSEADSGLGDDDVPNDIVIDGDDVQVRAERYSIDGRAYTIDVAVTFDGQVVLTEATVTVDHDQRVS